MLLGSNKCLDEQLKILKKILFKNKELVNIMKVIDECKIGIDLGCGKYKDAHLCALILNENGKQEFIYS